jgi:hypothetical protein
VDAPKARPCPERPALRFGHQAARCCAAGMHSPAQSQRRPDRWRVIGGILLGQEIGERRLLLLTLAAALTVKGAFWLQAEEQ